MDRKEHIHIISAGEKIHVAFPAAFRELPGITRTIVFTDSTVHETSPDPVTEKHRLAVRHAVAAVQEIATSLSLPFTREMIFPPAYDSVRSALAKYRQEFPDAWFTFDLSGGSKELCLALFAIAPWLGGVVYASFDEKTARRVPLPDPTVSTLLENPNYQTILAVLIRNSRPGKAGKAGKPGDTGDAAAGRAWTSRQYLFEQVWPLYTRSRTRIPAPDEPGTPLVRYRKGHKPAQNMSHATFSGFMVNLRNAGLVEEGHDEKNRKEKVYRITGTGDMAFRFYSRPVTNTLVKSMLESP
jgi:hypothetical protein